MHSSHIALLLHTFWYGHHTMHPPTAAADHLAPPMDAVYSHSSQPHMANTSAIEVERTASHTSRRQNTAESQTPSILISHSYSSSGSMVRSHSTNSDGHVHFQEGRSLGPARHAEPAVVEEPESLNDDAASSTDSLPTLRGQHAPQQVLETDNDREHLIHHHGHYGHSGPTLHPSPDHHSERASTGSVSDRSLSRLGGAVAAVSALTLAPLASEARTAWHTLQGERIKAGDPESKIPTWKESARKAVLFSRLNVLLIFVPFAWTSHFLNTEGRWPHQITFSLCFLSIVPLANIFEWGGEQIAMYLEPRLGDLVVISLGNSVEAVLAIVLLTKCELRLLQSTIIGVIILYLLLVQGTSAIVQGLRRMQVPIDKEIMALNHGLICMGVIGLLLPTTFFYALNSGGISPVPQIASGSELLTDGMREEMLHMGRGIAVILLVVYIGARVFLYKPTPKSYVHQRADASKLKMNSWSCIVMLVLTVTLMAVTVEFLVESVEDIRTATGIRERWFGLIFLPFISYSAEASAIILVFATGGIKKLRNRLRDRSRIRHRERADVMYPDIDTESKNAVEELTRARAIDRSIQFTLFWMPVVVLVGWWQHKPMHLMFDLFELALLISASFLTIFSTTDFATNWAKGLLLYSLYALIALCAWWYPGQTDPEALLVCPGPVDAFWQGNSSTKEFMVFG